MKLYRLAGMMTSALLMVSLVGCDFSIKDKILQKESTTEEVVQPTNMEEWMDYYGAKSEKDEVTCWYSDENDKAWLEAAAKSFQKKYKQKVNCVYYDGVQMFEDMNQANQKGKGPDLYIAGNDQLELAVTGALAEENEVDKDFWKKNYPEIAKNAVTYKGKQYGYPVYFDTYCLVYDAKLLETAPASIDDILAFADAYEDTGSTKAIFRWDVADPYINTMFLNNYVDLFGEYGDDANSFLINSDKAIEAMEYFKSLSAYLWMDKSNISHDTVKNRIQDSTLVLGLCKSDILDVLYNFSAAEDESEAVDYKVAYVPSLTAELSSSSFSTTYSAFVNPYGENEIGGNMFGMYLSLGQGEKQYEGNHKLPVVDQKDGFDEMQSVFYGQYLNSKPVPKVLILGDYLSEAGIAYDAIWSGKDVKEELDLLQDKMSKKIGK